MKKLKNIKYLLGVAFLGLIVFLGSFLKVSFLVGETKSVFSGINFCLPMLGYFCGISFASIFIVLFFLTKQIFLNHIFTLGLPTFFATLNWSFSFHKKSLLNEIANFFLRIFVPMLCITLFVVHPVGQPAYLYSFYWFIPIVLYFLEKFKIHNSIFSIALTSTFLAHAVGSIIWLYTIPTNSNYWMILIPRVAIERIVFACGMSVIYLCVKRVSSINYSRRNNLNVSQN